MKVKINIISGLVAHSIFIDDVKNECLVDGVEKVIDTKAFIDNLLPLTISWKKKMIGEKYLDGNSYSLEITDGDQVISYVGKNSFPENYNEFVELIRGVIAND